MPSYREITLVEKSHGAYVKHQRRHAQNKITYGRRSRRDAYGDLCLKLEWLVRRLLIESSAGGEMRLWRERVLSYVDLSKGWRQQRFRELDGVIGGDEPVYVLEIKASTSPAVYQAKRQASRSREIMAHRFGEVFVVGVWIDTRCLVETQEEMFEEEASTKKSVQEFLDIVSGAPREDLGFRLELEELLAVGERAGAIESTSQLMLEASRAIAEKDKVETELETSPVKFEEKDFFGDSPFAALLEWKRC